jgi:hypothetical protein
VRLRDSLCGQLLFIDSETLGCDRGIREVHFEGNLALNGIVIIDLSLMKVLFGGVRSGSEKFLPRVGKSFGKPLGLNELMKVASKH